MELRKNFLEDTVEMGAALSMEATSEAAKYAIDDKIIKLKEHWESVWEKVVGQMAMLDNLMEEWRRFSGLRIQLETWMETAEVHLSDSASKDFGNTVTDIEKQLQKHKVCVIFIRSLFWFVLEPVPEKESTPNGPASNNKNSFRAISTTKIESTI